MPLSPVSYYPYKSGKEPEAVQVDSRPGPPRHVAERGMRLMERYECSVLAAGIISPVTPAK